MQDLVQKYRDFMASIEKGQLIGIDIGLSAVKMCVLEEGRKGKYKLTKFGYMPLSEASVIEDEIQKPEEIIDSVSDILKSFKEKKRIACLGIDGPNTVTKRLQVPDGVDEEVEDNILWESEQYIPFGADDAEIDYSILGRIEEEDVVDTIVGAAKIDVVEKYIEYLKEAGVVVRVIDLNCFSIVNVFEMYLGDRLDEVSDSGAIIIDFGAQYTSIIVYKNSGPVLTRELNIGGVLVTEEIQRTMGVSYEEAENLKIYGDDNGNLPQEVVSIVQSHTEKLIEELRKVLNFYIAAGSSEVVEYCFVTGGSSKLPGMLEALSELVDLDIEEIDPLEVIEPKGKFSPEETEYIKTCGLVALGLGMRKV